MIKKKILIATGGTGGHVFPACSLANYLKSKEHNVEITTDQRGLKYFQNFKDINLKKMPSSRIVKKNIFKFLFSILIIIYSIIRSFLFLLFDRPKIIFGMGGYSSFPICIAAATLKIKFVIYENNLIVGKSNRYLLPFAQKIFVSFKELEGIPKKYNYKVFEIGNLVRDEIINSNQVKDNDEELFSNNISVLVLGGSQAAKTFAEELPPVFEKLNNAQIPLKVYQQCQKVQMDQLSKFYQKTNINHELFYFSNKIVDYYNKANLVITRSGASVLAELVNKKIAFITIPLPSSADNHQFKNAEFYQKKGYGYLLEEKNIKNKLYDLISNIFKDKTLITNFLSNQRQYSDKNIFKSLDNQIKKIIDEKD